MSSRPIKKEVCEDPSEDSNEDVRPKVSIKENYDMGNRKKQKTKTEGTIHVRFHFWNEEQPILVEGSYGEPVLKALRRSEHFETTFTKSKKKGIRIHASEKLKAMVKGSLPCGLLPAGELLKITLVNREQPEKVTVSGKDQKLFCIAARGETENGDRRVILSCRYLKKNRRRLALSAPEDQTLLKALQEDGRFEGLNFMNIFYLRPPDKSGKCEPNTKVGLLKDSEFTYTLIVTNNPRNQPQETVEAGQGDGNSTSQSSAMQDTLSETSTSAQNQEMGTGIQYRSGRPLALHHTNLQRLQCEQFENTFNEDKKFRQDFAASAKKFEKEIRKATPIEVHELLAVLGQSVGYFYWGKEGIEKNIHATCFMLEEHYIITNCHVMEMILKLAKEILLIPSNEELTEASFNVSLASLAKVTFQYKGRVTQQSVTWYPIKRLCAHNRDLDYALLELTLEGSAPPPGGLIGRLSGHIPDELVYIIGHPGGGPKATDTCTITSNSERTAEFGARLREGVHLAGPACQPVNCEVANPDVSCFHILRQRYEEGKDEHFPLLGNQNALSYDTNFFEGASGSPVFNSRGELVALHSNGYVGKYRWRKKYILEFGYSMQAIWADIQQAKLGKADKAAGVEVDNIRDR